MPPGNLHPSQVPTDETLVRKLLTAQFPQWAGLPVAQVRSGGTVNALYRLGTDMAVRLPILPEFAGDLAREHRWLPRLAPLLPLEVPVPLAQGEPGEGYPFPWSIHRWLPGEDAQTAAIIDLGQAAIDLAGFIRALWKVDLEAGPPSGRGRHVWLRDPHTRKALESLQGEIDTAAAAACWAASLQAPDWERAVWTHGDLISPNLLVRNGRLRAVIDFGALGFGDPACDLVPAWSVLTAETRPIFRARLEVDEATWIRGRGWALSQALLILPYYRHTNPVLVAVAERMVQEILTDQAAP